MHQNKIIKQWYGSLTKDNELKRTRVVIDIKTHEPSITIVCEEQQNSIEQLKVYLAKQGIILNNKIETEVLNDKENTQTEPQCTHQHAHQHPHAEQEHKENHWQKAALGFLWGISLFILSVVGFNVPLPAYAIITILSTLMTFYIGRSVYQSAWQALRTPRWDMTTLYCLSTLTIIATSIASLFIPGIPLMFEAAPLVLGFWHLGEGIEHSLIKKINTHLDVRECISPMVQLKDGLGLVAVNTLVPNDMISLSSGMVIPVDGIIQQDTFLYTTRINGSPNVTLFKAGQAVKSGMSIAPQKRSLLTMQVSKPYQNSYLSLIANNIIGAQQEKTAIELLANKILAYFIPGLLAVAALSGILISTFFSPALAIQCVVSVLVSACPCALSLITPLAVKIGMNKAAEHGVIFNNSQAIHTAATIDAIVFDLNGTLTQGKIAVDSLQLEDNQFLAHIALLESKSAHSVAAVISSYVKQNPEYINSALTLTNIDKSHHSGIKGQINGEQFIIGNQSMLAANGIETNAPPYNNPEQGSIYVVRGTKVIGQISATDPLRADAVATITQLKKLGKKIHLCTGADEITAKRYAQLLGINPHNICANTVGIASNTTEYPKAQYIKQLQQQGYKVAMVGDATNDLPAIKQADIGIAIQSTIGDETIQQQADIVIQKGLLMPLASAFDVAQKTLANIWQNLLVSLTYNSTITVIAAGAFVTVGFTLNPVLGVALMILESTLVLGNLYRLKQQQISTPATHNREERGDDKSSSSTSHLLNTLNNQVPVPKKTTKNDTLTEAVYCSFLPTARAPRQAKKQHHESSAAENSQAHNTSI